MSLLCNRETGPIAQSLLESGNADTEYTNSSAFLNITTLAIPSMSQGRLTPPEYWPSELISWHASNLEALTIGFETEMLRAFEFEFLDSYTTSGGRLSSQSVTVVESIIESLKCNQKRNKRAEISSIKVLRFSCFDLDAILIHPRPFIDFSKLTSLLLESCVGLESGLARLTSKASLPHLCSLTVRTEFSCGQLWSSLESFICSLGGLTDLYLLMEGSLLELKLEGILITHGKTLKTLIIDTRTGPRWKYAPTTSTQPQTWTTLSYLNEISKHCPYLVELGVTIDWAAVQEPGSPPEDV